MTCAHLWNFEIFVLGVSSDSSVTYPAGDLLASPYFWICDTTPLREGENKLSTLM